MGTQQHHCDVLVVGGGTAGIAASTELAAAGLRVELCEQSARLGGAIHRQPADGTPATGLPSALGAQWQRLSRSLTHADIVQRTRHVFLGIDSDGLSLLEDRAAGIVTTVRAAAVVLAVGAVERVTPRAGWQLAGVTTAGGMQVMMKETGRAPSGRILIAGNGPLLIALAAQLTKLGNPPVAVLESGDPLRRPGSGLGLLAQPRIASEALGYLVRLTAAGVQWRRAAALTAIERRGEALLATIVDRSGRETQIDVDRIALHDGIRCNAFGLPASGDSTNGGPLIVRAGDCREALGAIAAEADGRRAAHSVMVALRGGKTARDDMSTPVVEQRKAQALLSELFRPVNLANDPRHLADDTILCRCENKTVGDLRGLLAQDGLSPREIKLNGRFGMGACQGRFCADTVMAVTAASQSASAPGDIAQLTGSRWPLRPVSIASLAATEIPAADANRPTE